MADADYDRAMTVSFIVEQAGCPSCASKVRQALAPLGEVEDVVVDESADVGIVRLETSEEVSEERVNALLAEASGSGHAYKVRSGSFAET